MCVLTVLYVVLLTWLQKSEELGRPQDSHFIYKARFERPLSPLTYTFNEIFRWLYTLDMLRFDSSQFQTSWIYHSRMSTNLSPCR